MAKFDFVRLTNYKYLSQIKGNSVNYYDLLKLITSFGGGHCSYSSRAWKSLATPLMGGEFMVTELKQKPDT